MTWKNADNNGVSGKLNVDFGSAQRGRWLALIMAVVLALSPAAASAQDFLQTGSGEPTPVLLPVELPEPTVIALPPQPIYFDPLCQCVTHTHPLQPIYAPRPPVQVPCANPLERRICFSPELP